MATPRKTLLQIPNPDVPGSRLKFRQQDGWRGDKKSCYPYSTVFEVVHGVCRNPLTGVMTAYDAGNAPGNFQIPASKAQSTYNQAYSRAMKKAKGVTAQVGATLGEYGQSSRMVKNAAEALLYTTKSLLGMFIRQKRRHRRKRAAQSFADFWLENSFGWAPLFGTMYDAMMALSAPVEPKSFYGSATCFHEGKTAGMNPRHSYSYVYRVAIFGDIHISNPNVALANNLGLVNPAAIAWELVRFSFVLDWMFDIGAWINSWTENWGFEISNSGVSKIQFGSMTQTWTALLGQSRSNSLVATRDTGIAMPLPNLDVLRNIGDNLNRAANALALTTQILLKKR